MSKWLEEFNKSRSGRMVESEAKNERTMGDRSGAKRKRFGRNYVKRYNG